MDITGIDIGVLATGIGAIVKAYHSDRKTETAKKGIDERMAVIENDLKHHDKRLDEGDNAFKTLDAKMDRNNELLNQLLGEIRGAGRK